MILSQVNYEKKHIANFINANLDWKSRLRLESRYVHYDYASDILFMRFGKPSFVIMTYMDHDDDEFEWGYDEGNLHIVAIHLMPFRNAYVPRYPKLRDAYASMCRDWGEGDWNINIPSHAETATPTTASTFADTLLECARDPIPVPSSEI